MVTVREYSNETFSAEGAARHYFASYNESEIDRFWLLVMTRYSMMY